MCALLVSAVNNTQAQYLHMMLYSTLFLSTFYAVVSGAAFRFAYLPPDPSESNTTEAPNESVTINVTYLPPEPSESNTTEASTETFAERFGEGDGSIHFEVEDTGERTLWQRQVDRIISRGVLQLALHLDQVMSPESRPEEGRKVSYPAPMNVVFSPLSIASALALVLLGAGGQTYQEVSRVLGLSMGTDLAVKSNVVHEQFGSLLARFDQSTGVPMTTQTIAASAIFVQDNYPIKPRFRQLSRSTYKSDIVNLDFVGHGGEAQAAVNSWVEAKTQGRIKDLLSQPPSPDTRLLIASALYFNGEWEHPFPYEFTSKRPFYVTGDQKNPGEVLEITAMANDADLPYHVSPKYNCRIAGLPYKGREVVMYFVLPNKTGHKALKDLENKLTPTAIEELVTATKEQNILVLIPRMKLDSTVSLKDALVTLGVRSLFNPLAADLSFISSGEVSENITANGPFIFSRSDDANTTKNRVNSSRIARQDDERMIFRERRQTGNPGLYADDVIHRVEIDITETGTVASAATLVSVTRDGSRSIFRADRPFLFFIRHEPTGLILFWGSVVRPTPYTVKDVKE